MNCKKIVTVHVLSQASLIMKSQATFSLALHRCHDYRYLIQGWKRVARKLEAKLQPYCQYDGEILYYLARWSKKSQREIDLYLSAGIHGDEPAGPEALLQWAERNGAKLGRMNYLIFPCLNPWGIKNNCRYDSKGNDLNRSFRSGVKLQCILAWRKLLKNYQFQTALMLHEDYDAQGTYLYELNRTKKKLGEELIESARPWIAPEPRKTVDGRRCRNGLIRPAIDPKRLTLHPEAIYLYFHHTSRSITIETPSEFSLDCRVEAQVTMIEKAVQLI